MKFVFLSSCFLGAHLDLSFADARQRSSNVRRGLKKSKQAQDHTSAGGDSFFSYYYGGASGDFSYANGSTSISRDNSSADGNMNTSGDSEPTDSVEGGADPSGSNDSTQLERICDLYSEFENSVSNNFAAETCQNFERFDFLMCPEEYNIQRICTSSTGLTANLSDAIMHEYCLRFFPENLNSTNGMPCSELCHAFVVEADCCKVQCP